MVIAASVILLLAILLAPIFLIQFRKRWVAAFKAMIMNMFVHTAHHRAQCEVYLRVKGIKPPDYRF